MIHFATINPKPVQVQQGLHKISQAANGIEPNRSNGECSGHIIANIVVRFENREPGLRVVPDKRTLTFPSCAAPFGFKAAGF